MREKEIFLKAVEMSNTEERAKYLEETCRSNPELKQRVEALLAAGANANQKLGPSAAATELPTSPYTADPMLGTVFADRYKIREKLGEGGMGTVYIAHQIEPVQRHVALKLIKGDYFNSSSLARFEQERQALAMMDHPNIAKVLDAGISHRGDPKQKRDGGTPYFVMELIKGIPITKYCDDARLSPQERLELFIPVCHAVQHAHQKGIIHRDLKPSNILIGLYDGRPVPKVIDFGVAKVIGPKVTDQSVYTQMGSLIGTLEYMSPEQAELNNLDIDTRTDVYALGVVLYELLTGMVPFSQKEFAQAGLVEMLMMIKEVEPPKPSTKLSGSGSLPAVAAMRKLDPKKLTSLIKGELDWIALRALEKDRNRRYGTPGSFADDIERYLRHEAVLARPPSPMYKLQKFVQRKRATVITGMAVVILLVTGTVVSIWQAMRAVQAEAGAIAERDEKEKARSTAANERQRAEANERKALDALTAAQRNLYHASISLAHREWFANRTDQTEKILDACPVDQRGWEWRYLKRLCRSELLAIEEPDVRLLCISISPDGRRIAVASWNDGVKIWDLNTRTRVIRIPSSVPIHAVAYSPDGRLLAFGGGHYSEGDKTDPGVVKVCDAATGTEVFSLKGHPENILCVAFSPDSHLLASGSNDSVKIWDTTKGKELTTIQKKEWMVQGVAFSPDGTKFATASRDSLVRIWDPKSWKELATLEGHERIVWSVAFSPDNKRLVTASDDNTVKIWDLETRRVVQTFRGHTGDVVAAVFSPDGHLVASGGAGGSLKVWDAMTGQVKTEIHGHTYPIVSLAFSTDGRLVSADSERSVKVWDHQMGQEALSLREHPNGASSIAFSPNGKRIVSSSLVGRLLNIWETETGVLLHRIRAHENFVNSIAYSPDGKLIVTASNDETVKVWDASTGAQLSRLEFKANRITFTPEGTMVAVCPDGTVRFWNLAEKREIRTVRGPGVTIAFSLDGKRFATDGPENQVVIWDTTTGKELLSLRGHTDSVNRVAFSSNGSLVASAGEDRTVRVWDSHTGESRATLTGHSARVTRLAFSPDDTRLVSAGWEMTVRVWETATWQGVITLQGHTDRVDDLAFSPDGNRIASGSFDGSVRIWDAAPMTSDLQDQREVGRFIRYSQQKSVLRDDLIEAVHKNTSQTDSAKQRALTLAASIMEDSDALNSASWLVVSTSDASLSEYHVALRRAIRACAIQPNNSDYLGTLGTAYYRTKEWKKALLELEKTVSMRKPDDPTNANEGFFIAMAHWHLGAKDEARKWFDKSVTLMEKNTSDLSELRSFRAEAAKLLQIDSRQKVRPNHWLPFLFFDLGQPKHGVKNLYPDTKSHQLVTAVALSSHSTIPLPWERWVN